MATCDVGQKYLENPPWDPIVSIETFYSHCASLVFSIAHVRETSIALKFPGAYMLLLKGIRRGYDPARLADLANKP